MSLKKKFLSGVTAAILSISLTVGTPNVEAASSSLVGAAVGIGKTLAEGAAVRSKLNAQINQVENSEEGRQQLYKTFREKYGVNEDPAYNELLDRIMSNLTRGVAAVDPTINSKPYLYFVSAQENLNAACGMGHVMMVNAGTFKRITNEDELAAIVGHEMGHGQKSHASKGVKKQLNKVITAKVLTSAAGAAVGSQGLTSIIGDIALTHSIAHGSRKQETEADLLGVDYLIHTNYNPGACAAVMQKFVELEGSAIKSSRRSSFFNPSDHPDSAKRRDNCAKKLFEYSYKHAEVKDGTVLVNKKTFMKPVASSEMSGAERSYFVLGNLARAFHNGQNKHEATVVNGKVMLGSQEIVTPLDGDEDAQVRADRLNSLK